MNLTHLNFYISHTLSYTELRSLSQETSPTLSSISRSVSFKEGAIFGERVVGPVMAHLGSIEINSRDASDVVTNLTLSRPA